MPPHLPARAADILEQIEMITPMIVRYADDPLLRNQYQKRKSKLVKDLSAILRYYNLLDGELTAA